MYLRCRICNRVTDHSKHDKQSNSYNINGSIVNTNVFYICPHCNTGVAGTEVNIKSNINNSIISSFESNFGQ